MNLKTAAQKKTWLVIAPMGLVSVGLAYFYSKDRTDLRAISLSAPGKKFAFGAELKPENIAQLLADSKLEVTSDANTVVPEPPLPAGQIEPPDADALGFGRSKFMLDSKWSTIRYLGNSPAGAGLSGSELNKAQIAALGTADDTIPVVTAAQTIHEMMENYFAPLLRSLPRGEDILSRIKIQGAYFSPRYQPSDGSTPERDNAFISGVQSLYLYPNSCFDRTANTACNPIGFSAGHDPTIIGHELGHVIFNHMRDERSLEGWQWFAVNEGYADYFSAAYFGDPILGRIWRVTRPSGARYLRRLLDTPTTNDAKALQEGHAFGLVWSSALWRIRNTLVNANKANPLDFDRVVLLSINFLGESTKTKLGDAAASVLKAADVLGMSNWKSTMVAEFRKAEVDLARGEALSSATGETIGKEQGGIVCGAVANKPTARSTSASWFLLTLPLFFLAIRRRSNTGPRLNLLLALLSLPFLSGCQLASLWRKETPQPNGLAIVYDCSLAALRDGTPAMPARRKLSLVFPEKANSEPRLEQIFVGDERFENADSSLLMLLDKQTMRIDQVRRRDGSLFQLNLNQRYVSSEDALAVQNMRLGTIVLEGVGRALLTQKNQQPIGANGKSPAAISFELTGIRATATLDDTLFGARGFGPLAREIAVDGEKLCTYESTKR